MGQLKNPNDETVLCGDRVYYDRQKDFWRCRFAPDKNGIFDAIILAKKKTDPGTYTSAISFKLSADKISSPSFSFPKTWQVFYDLDLKIVSPVGRGIIDIRDKIRYADIHIKAPDDVSLISQLKNEKGEEIPGGDQIYYDNKNDCWRCKFAPNANGSFDGLILAKKKSDPGSYTSAVSFKIKAKQLGSHPTVTFPKTWQRFYDFDLKILAPRSRSTAIWKDNASYAEILIQAPDDIQLSCSIEYKNEPIENGALAQFDHDKQLWQLLFAPEQKGQHQLIIYARRIDDKSNSANSVVMFLLNVTSIRQRMKFPIIYNQFQTNKCRIYTPLHGKLKKGSKVSFHFYIPGATSVSLTVDSKTVRSEGYVDPIFQQEITVGSEEVTIYVKYGDSAHSTSLIEYSVE
jgi:hypothetical protein